MPLDNAFAAVDDVAAVQAICDGLDEGKITALAGLLLRLLPYPFTAEDAAAGYRYELSVLQGEFSLTQILDAPVTGRIFFDQLIRDNLDLGRPDRVSLLFGRKIIRKGRRATPGRFRTRIITEGVTPSLHVDYKNSKIKQYHKLGQALRTETTINDTVVLKTGRGLEKFPEITARLAGMADRFCTMLDCVDTGFIPGGLLDELPLPSQIGAVRTGGIDLNKPRSRAVLAAALALAIAPGGFTVAGFAAKVRDMTGQAGYTTRNAAYDLRKLRGKHLADKPGRTRRYLISPGSARIISALLTLREQVIAPLLAGVADPRIRRTPRHWTDIDRHYQALRLEMMALFADIGIACG